MNTKQIKMWLEPESNGSCMRLRLCGSVPTMVSRAATARLARGLSFWSGWPVSCVLCVAEEAARWCEWWTDLLAGIPERHLKLHGPVRCVERRRGQR